jgi:hypothetical protein
VDNLFEAEDLLHINVAPGPWDRHRGRTDESKVRSAQRNQLTGLSPTDPGRESWRGAFLLAWVLRSMDRRRWFQASGITAKKFASTNDGVEPVVRQAQPAYSIFCADTAGMQSFTASLQYHKLGEHLVVLVLFLNGVRTLQLRLQRRNSTHDREELQRS